MSKELQQQPPQDEGPRDFARFLAILADGEASAELSENLHELAKVLSLRVGAKGTPVQGSLALTLNFTAEPGGVVNVTYAIKRTDPQPGRPRSVVWITKGGNFTEQNPRQQKLQLREVTGSRGPAREIIDADGVVTAAREV